MKKIVLGFLALTVVFSISACSYSDNFLEPVYVESESNSTADTVSISDKSENSDVVSQEGEVSPKADSSVSAESNVSVESVKSVQSEASDVNANIESELLDDKEYDIALITDKNGISSDTNLSLWKSIIAYGDTNCLSYKYYIENDSRSNEDLMSFILERKAKSVVVSEEKYKNSVIDLQKEYSDVNFLLLNIQPDKEFAKNVHCIKFKEEQAGYLAGYLSILDGKTTLGFIGDGDNAENKRYLYGMVLGADAATQELRLHGTSIQYIFIKPESEKAKKVASQMYKEGTDVILSCNENITQGVAQAAKDKKKKFICAGVPFNGDKSAAAFMVEYDIAKALDYTVENKLDDNLGWNADNNENNLNLGLESGCMTVPTDKNSWHMKNISADIYNDIAAKMISGELVVSDKVSEQPPIAAIVYDQFYYEEKNEKQE